MQFEFQPYQPACRQAYQPINLSTLSTYQLFNPAAFHLKIVAFASLNIKHIALSLRPEINTNLCRNGNQRWALYLLHY